VNGNRVLVIDDELSIRRLLRATLERAGYVVVEAVSAREALDAAGAAQAEVVLLDLGLPDRDGLELVPLLKRAGRTAIIVVSAREATEEKVAALDLGADDYVTKPFDTEELLARVRAALRGRIAAQGGAPVVRAGAVTIDLPQRLVMRDGAEVHLTRKEFEVLAQLAGAPGRVVTHQRILAAAWPYEHDRRVEYLRIVVRNLRRKLEADPARPALIINELGIGYRLLADG
jgi:two-component system KDP operon response regulator KdpE